MFCYDRAEANGSPLIAEDIKDAIAALVSANPTSLGSKDINGNSPLILAAINHNNTQAVEGLLAKASVRDKTEAGEIS